MKNDSIAIITPTKFPGTSGDTATLTELIRQLVSDGINVTLICPGIENSNLSIDLGNTSVIRIPGNPPRLAEISGGIGTIQKFRFILFILSETFVVAWILKRKGIKHVILRPSIQTIHLPPILKLLGITIIADGAELVSDSMKPLLKPRMLKTQKMGN